MKKIVTEGVKVDFHIHSCFSKYKDGKKVENNTIENTSILIQKLKENKINMAAITDHDYFSFGMYEKLKDNDANIKFIPGVEFSIKITNGKKAHVIALFNDSNIDKLKKINENIVDNDKPCYDLDNCFSESKFLEILRKIDLDVVLIAHQKNSPLSTTPKSQDLSYSGSEIFNKYIGSQYFNAIELRNIRNDHFYKIYKQNNSLNNMRWITGSDCHNWEVYPQYDVGKNDIIDFTYMKILKSFRGLLMAFTDESRISIKNNFFKLLDNAIKEVEIEQNGTTTKIPVSNGINVIIGDNSVGKSALLHMLTNENLLTPKTKYNKFKKKYKLSIVNKDLSEKDYRFDTQGAIRKRMEEDKFNILNHFGIDSKSNLDNTPYVKVLKDKLEKLLLFYRLSQKPDNELELKLKNKDLKRYSLYFLIIEEGVQVDDTDLQEISNVLERILVEFDQLIQLSEEKKFKLIRSILIRYKEKIMQQIKVRNFETSKKEIINKILNDYNDNKNEYISSLESATNSYNKEKNNFIRLVVSKYTDDYILKKAIERRDEELQEKPVTHLIDNFGSYKLVTRFRCNIDKINQNYFEKLFLKMFRKNSEYDVIKNSYSEMFNELKQKKDFVKSQYNEVELEIKDRFNSILEDEFSIKSIILPISSTSDEEYSTGMNSKIYFDILNSVDKKSIYFIDQPEDDLSQKALKEQVLSEFKKMAKTKQIFIVTHNPQFIVNLDVDNVIYIEKNLENLSFKSGALEYFDSEYSILDIISENIDGGSETIEKRWKRYGN